MPTFLLVKVRKEKNSVEKNNVQGDKGTSEHPAFNSHVKKAKLPELNPELNYRGNRYTVKEFDRVVGFQEKGKLSDLIEKYKHSTES